MLVAAHLGDGHAAGGVLEGLAEGLLAGPQRLLLPFEPDERPLHVGPQPGVADRDGGLRRVHLEGLAAPGAGAAAVARAVHGDDAQQIGIAAGRVHRGVEAVLGVPLVLEPGVGPVGVPLRYVVVEEDPAVGVRYEAELVPGPPHRQPALPGGARADPAGDQGLGRAVAREGGDDEITVGADQVHTGQLVAETVDDSVGHGLQRVGQAPRRIEIGDGLVQLPHRRKADVRLRLGLHCSHSPRPRQHSRFHIDVLTAVSPQLNHSELCSRYTGSTNIALCDSSHNRW